MKYISTGNPNIFTNSFTETIVNPIPEENHLWIPENLSVVKCLIKMNPFINLLN